jgi:hypothetical protein
MVNNPLNVIPSFHRLQELKLEANAAFDIPCVYKLYGMTQLPDIA